MTQQSRRPGGAEENTVGTIHIPHTVNLAQNNLQQSTTSLGPRRALPQSRENQTEIRAELVDPRRSRAAIAARSASLKDAAAATLPKMAVLMRRKGGRRQKSQAAQRGGERASRLISSEQQTQVTPSSPSRSLPPPSFRSLSFSLSFDPSTPSSPPLPPLSPAQPTVKQLSNAPVRPASRRVGVPLNTITADRKQTTDRVALKVEGRGPGRAEEGRGGGRQRMFSQGCHTGRVRPQQAGKDRGCFERPHVNAPL